MAASMLTSAMVASSPYLSRGASSRSDTDAGASGILGSTSSTLPRDCNPLQLALPTLFSPKRVEKRRWRSLRCRCSSSRNFDQIPKQFREENLKEGLMDNYKNVPRYLYGLSASQMDMFMTEDSIIAQQSQKVTEESISSARNYLDNGGMWSLSGAKNGPSKYSMKVSMYRGGSRHGRLKNAPPDLPSLLLDARICYLGMPIVPAVAELIVAQLIWLDYDNPSKPVYLYINSTGTQNPKRELVGSETDAYAIADTMNYIKPNVYTVNVAMAFGQAGMLLSLGTKGYRALQPHAATKLYLPKVNKSSGSATDVWVKSKEVDANADSCLELLSKGIGKPKEEIARDLQGPRFFFAQEAIDYGIADRIVHPDDSAFEKKDYDGLLAQSKATRRGIPGGPQSAPSGFK